MKEELGGKKPFLAAAIGLLVVILGVEGIIYFRSSAEKKNNPSLSEETPFPIQESEKAEFAPTLSEEKKEIIAKIQTQEIIIEEGRIAPEKASVRANDQVTWINKDNANHIITGEGWGGVAIAPGESFTKTFEEPGTYPYFCSLQPELKGTIIVE